MIFHPTNKENIFHLSPIPVYKRRFINCPITKKIDNLGFRILSKEQKLMGQELPNQYDNKRQDNYKINYDYQEEWVENHNLQPIGSRFFVKPNNFLSEWSYQPEKGKGNKDVDIIIRRIKAGFKELTGKDGEITESWAQYYEPGAGRGHNAHNHNRWQHEEEKPLMYSGGYYLDDGDPLKDHPYSGAFAFHIGGKKHYVRPREGMLLIWPHDIIHSVEPFYGKRHRAVINFNIQA